MTRGPRHRARGSAGRGSGGTGRLLAANGVANVIRGLSASLLTTALPIVLARALDLANYKAWTAAFGTAAAISYLDFGVLSAVSALVGKAQGPNGAESRSEVVRSATLVLSLCSAPVLLGYFVAAFFADQLMPDAYHLVGSSLGWSLAALAAAQTVILFINIPSGYYSGLQQSARPAKLLVVSRVATLFALAAIAMVTNSILIISVAFLITSIATMLLLYGAVSREVPALGGVSRAALGRLFSILRVSSVQSIAMMVVSGVDIIVVSAVDYENVGQYGLASSFSLLLFGLVSALMSPILPHLAKTGRLVGEHAVAELAMRLCPVIAVVLTWLACCYGLAVAVLGPTIAGNKFGHVAADIVIMLSVAAAIRQCAGPVAMGLLVSTSKRRVMVIPAIAEALANLALSISLGKVYGAPGVAAGTLIGALVGLVVWGVMIRFADLAWRERTSTFVLSTVIRSVAIAALLLWVAAGSRHVSGGAALVVPLAAVACVAAAALSIAPARVGAREVQRALQP